MTVRLLYYPLYLRTMDYGGWSSIIWSHQTEIMVVKGTFLLQPINFYLFKTFYKQSTELGILESLSKYFGKGLYLLKSESKFGSLRVG